MVKYGNLILRTKDGFGKVPYSARIGGFIVDYRGKELTFYFLNATSSVKILTDGRVEMEWDLSNLDQDLYREDWEKLGLLPEDLTAEFLTSLRLIDFYGGIYPNEDAEKNDESIEASIISFSLRDENSDKHFNFEISDSTLGI
jgi:hypothetical protein